MGFSAALTVHCNFCKILEIHKLKLLLFDSTKLI